MERQMTKEGLWSDPEFCRALIPSATVWEHLGDWKPTDFELAALVSHMEVPLEQKDGYLEVICRETDDEKLRDQIQAFFQRWERFFTLLSDNDGSYIYVLRSLGGKYEKIYGYFCDFGKAQETGKGLGVAFEIEKYPLGYHKRQLAGAWDPRGTDMPDEKMLIYSEEDEIHPVGMVHYDQNGKVTRWWGVPDLDPLVPPGDSVRRHCDRSSFENAYVPLPNPFERGDIVAILNGYTGEVKRYGIVWDTREDWETYHKQDRYRDFWDEALIIECIDEKSGNFTHTHVSPLYLERETPKDKAIRDYLLEGQELLRGKGSMQGLFWARESYRDTIQQPPKTEPYF